MSHILYLILGSNLGERAESLKRASDLISLRVGKILDRSLVYETEAWEGSGSSKIKSQSSKVKSQKSEDTAQNSELGTPNSYLNQVLKINTDSSPEELLSKISDIENELGRERETSEQLITNNEQLIYQPRTIDIDILFYDDIVYNLKVKTQKSKVNIQKTKAKTKKSTLKSQNSEFQPPNSELLTPNFQLRTSNSELKGHLSIPHPLISERKFVLVPLCEIASGLIHPVLNLTIKQLLDECRDENEVRVFKG